MFGGGFDGFGSSVWFDFLIYLMKGSYTENLELLLLTKRKYETPAEVWNGYSIYSHLCNWSDNSRPCQFDGMFYNIHAQIGHQTSILYPLTVGPRRLCAKNCWNSKNSIWSELWSFQSYGYLGGGFKEFFFFTPIWGKFPFWLIFFRWVETTNQIWYDINIRPIPDHTTKHRQVTFQVIPINSQRTGKHPLVPWRNVASGIRSRNFKCTDF